MGVQAEELKARTLRFALRTMAMADALPTDPTTRDVARQLVRAANAVAANYRSACRARSLAEFAARMGIVAEEADESLHWLQILTARGALQGDAGASLAREANELVAIFSRSQATARRRLRR